MTAKTPEAIKRVATIMRALGSLAWFTGKCKSHVPEGPSALDHWPIATSRKELEERFELFL